MDTWNKANPASHSAVDTQAFPVVGIGASAGGLRALLTLLENMPPSPGMALVVVLHLSPDVPSAVDKLLQRATDMPVVQVAGRTPILPNRVYVISPGRSLSIEDGHLVVDALKRPLGIPITINIFLRTLAEAQGARAIGVILSGLGSDGSAGLANIKKHGGVTIAQQPGDAEESSMPQAAIDSGMVDFVLPAQRMAAKLLEMRDSLQAVVHLDTGEMSDEKAGEGGAVEIGRDQEPALETVLSLLCKRTGYDFRQYKRPTILRRLERRLQVRGVPDLEAYHRLLEQDRRESKALLQDLLIGVTSFFRDREAFDCLEQAILPRLFQDKGPADELRAWVAACSSGEEAYSVAMLLADHASALTAPPALQVFASDIDERAIAVARGGRYPAGIAADVPPEYLARYFTQEDSHYKARKLLRDRILFAPHNLLQDPAFSRLDLITCRNFLIYLNREMQMRVLELFHAALNPGGYLFLGSAESTEMAPHLFSPVDAGHRLYQAKPSARLTRRLSVPPGKILAPVALFDHGRGAPAGRRGRGASFAEVHRRQQAQVAPPSLLLDAQGGVLHVSEHAGEFLHHAGGEPSRSALALVRPELHADLRTTLYQTRKTGRPARSAPIPIDRDGQPRVLRLAALPCADEGVDHGLILLQFEELDAAAAGSFTGNAAGQEDARVRELEEALGHARANLKQTIEESEAASHDLLLANDELQGLVEELRSRIDTLETGREELQSRNEELHTVNAELQMRVEETAKANDDLSNLIASTDIATLFLDHELRIQRYTPHVAGIFNIIAADIGRPLAHLTHRLDYPQLAEDVAGVLATLEPAEREVRSREGHDYIVRVHPYRTAYERVEGVVVTFFDISSRHHAEAALRASEEEFRLFVTASSDMLYKMSPDWSEMRTLQGKHILADTDDPTGSWLEKYIPEDERPRVLAAIHAAIETKSIFQLEHRTFGADGSIGWTFSRAVPLLDAGGNIVEWLGAGSDITERRRGEDALRASEARLASELAGTRLLQSLSTRLIPEQRPEDLHEEILDAAITLMKADAATIQLLEPDGGQLRLIASRNIHPQAQEFWQRVDTGHASACGEVLRTNARAAVEDVDASPAMAGSGDLAEFHRCGLRAVQSTPLRARSGRLIGMISTHWRAPRRIAEEDFYLFDVLARQLADLIERTQSEEAARAYEARHRADLERQVQERAAELKQSHDLLQATMDSSTDAIQAFEAVRDEAGVIVDFRWILQNATAAQTNGDVLGERVLEKNPGVLATGIFDTWREVAETGVPQLRERHYTHEQFDGWFLQSVVKLGDGVATTTKDITQWKQAQEEVMRLRP
ncbi:CheR family methyltransferase [Massilia sp. SYSU DXS3249]